MTQLIESGNRAERVVVSHARARVARAGFVARLIRNCAVQDWLITLYFALLLTALAMGSGPGRPSCIRWVLADVGFFLSGIILTRGGILRHGTFASSMVYRSSIFLTVFLSYFRLREILPAVNTGSLDDKLYAFDLRYFGVEPSLAWDRFVTPHTTEWFSFFYFGYFFLLSAHVLPMMLNTSSRFRLAHFSLGVFIVFCTGHLGYTLVPGWGPYRYLADQYVHPLEGGLFWNLVKVTVETGGAQKDIFPSLHTAVPTYFAIFSYMHRRAWPFRYTWPFMAFAATQIIGATLFLRWHYLIDIIAGLVLATTAALVSYWVALWEDARRERGGIAPVFSLIDWRKFRPDGDADAPKS